ncbi:MAG TPA: D-arabinono-1,4-lactone oxidase [Rubrobacteraceae bacterium]|nr:D-arabinono-1,4-lactone oxidase [Rubrobacteraceae bacterium]
MRVALFTTTNIVLNGLTLGRYVWLEGRVRRGVFTNWARRFRYRPQRFARPATEEEVVGLVRGSKSLRFFGSGHSFNTGVVSDEVLVSLDDYSGLVQRDKGARRISVRGGTRVRDVVDLLFDEGLAFRALPSHDAQSIGGILSTDVHGTGREWGFVSESVVGLELVDGKGEVHECGPEDDLFKAAIGGVGAVGIITEVTVEGVERFNVEQKVETADVSFVERNLDRLLRENEHLSFYLFPFTGRCRVNTWNRVERRRTPLGDLREFLRISVDALGAAWVGNFLAWAGLLEKLSPLVYGVERGSNLVLESNKAFNRTIYHLHQELEFTVPYEDAFSDCRRFIELYEALYPSGLPYIIFEVRFTPEGHDRTLIGAGRDRRCAWIDLVCNDSRGFERYYAAAEALIRQIGARPHLGKYCESFGEADLANLHGDNFAKFMDLVKKHDPDRKFANGFTRRLFGDGTRPASSREKHRPAHRRSSR